MIYVTFAVKTARNPKNRGDFGFVDRILRAQTKHAGFRNTKLACREVVAIIISTGFRLSSAERRRMDKRYRAFFFPRNYSFDFSPNETRLLIASAHKLAEHATELRAKYNVVIVVVRNDTCS